MHNLILDIDSYKASHFNQFPVETQQISNYIESRGGKFSHTIFFGLQRFLKKYLSRPITQEDIDQAEKILTAHGLPFNREGWQYILDKHQGYLPIKIQAVKEGTILPTSNVLVQVTNTDDNCHWLPGYLETAMLRAVWYPTTVATVSLRCKQIIYNALKVTTDLDEAEVRKRLAFKLHDFGARGASSAETSELGGLSHLINFLGTDSVLCLLDAQKYYGEEMAGFSIPAAEHATITTWGKDQEYQAIENMVDTYLGEGKLLSVLCDSYDMNNCLDNIICSREMLRKIKKSKGTCIIRLDSGDPVQVVVDTLYRLDELVEMDFNTAGFKVLPPYLRVMQGDGVNSDTIEKICNALTDNGFSVDNIGFGMGAELQQKVNRDTCKFAMKASAIRIGDQWHDCFKAPVTDPGKASKKGILKLINVNNTYRTVRADDSMFASYPDCLEVVYLNGKLVRDQSLKEIRELADKALETTIQVK